MGAVLSFLLSIPAMFKTIGEIIGVVNQIRRLFQKSAAEEQAKKEADHEQSQTDAKTKDDTSGSFNG